MNSNEILWCERYRPKTVSEAILPEKMKTIFQNMVDTKTVPNMLLSGKAGMGKTTAVLAMLNEIDSDYIMKNGNLNVGIDALRNEITQFASSVSFKGGRKFVILDESDGLSPAIQGALRNFIEAFSDNCGFIATCNHSSKIIPELHSRFSLIDFKIPKDEKQAIGLQFYKRITHILETENVEYDKKVIVQVIARYYPDWRKTINELQNYAASGKIDSGMLATFSEESMKTLLGFLKDTDFTNVRKWVGENTDIGTQFYTTFYHTASKYIEKDSIPQLVLILADYQFKAAFSVDPEINITACLTEIMKDCGFKD